MKGYSALLAMREMQIKITMRYHFTPVRMAIIYKSTSADEVVEKRNPSTLLVVMQIGAATVENSMKFPQETKNETAC